MRWVAPLFVVGCHFGDALPVMADAMADAPVDGVGSDVPGVCPNGFTAKGAHCYALESQQSAWPDARAMCKASGADLAFPADAATSQLMTQFIGDGRDYWVGIQDPGLTGMWVTVAGPPATYLPWAAGEPSSTGACVRVHQQGGMGMFVAEKCDLRLVAICDVASM